MSKLSFRARALDASKQMPIYMAEELPDLPDYSAINRAVPQMPSGMEKEEECEHHLQRAICAGLIIPTPEVSEIPEKDVHDRLYPANYKQPRQLIHMQPFTMEQDIPDYDMDSEDERWLNQQEKRIDLSPLKFEEMMDRLEKSSGQTVVTLNEAKALLKEDDDLIIAVFDYWLNKRLKLQHPLILSVKTEHRAGTAANNPYLAFRRRTEKMQTRKNRKNDETSYEKMLKLRRDLFRAVSLLEFVKRREKTKREYVHLTIEIFEKRYQARDFSGSIISELSIMKAPRPAFTPIFQNHYANQNWSKSIPKDEIIPRKEKRQYKKRKHKSMGHNRLTGLGPAGLEGLAVLSSDEEPLPQASPEPDDVDEEGQFAFRRNKLCSYHMPRTGMGNWPWCSPEDQGTGDKRFRFTLTSLSNPRQCVGFARRRMGRGGRVILDRVATQFDDLWRTLDFTIYDNAESRTTNEEQQPLPAVKTEIVSTNVFSEDLRNGSGVDRTFSNSDGPRRTSLCDVIGVADGGERLLAAVKEEPEETPPVEAKDSTHSPQELDEMAEFLRSVRKDWLHFRPKTPPAGYEPPCHLLPAEDTTFIPNAATPFSLELRTIEDSTTLLDNSTFVTTPFLFEDLAMDADVPVTDTRQLPITTDSDTFVQYANLNDSVSMSIDEVLDGAVVAETWKNVGCSKFSVSSTLATASPKLNSVGASSGDVRQRAGVAERSVNSANGIVSQFGLDASSGVTRTKLKPKQIYAYSGEVGNQGTNSLSLLTSAHTVTLNSHSANILELPISNDSNAVPAKSQCDSNATPSNSKNKTGIVRKNNLAMEVT